MTASMQDRYKWLFLLCLFMTLGFVSFFFLNRSPADVDRASRWAARVYDNLSRYGLRAVNGVPASTVIPNNTSDLGEGLRPSETVDKDSAETLKNDSAGENSTPSKELVKDTLHHTAEVSKPLNTTQKGASTENLTDTKQIKNKTDIVDSLIVDSQTRTTQKPTESGTHPPPTVPPDRRNPRWFIHDDTYTKSKCPSALRRNPEKVPQGLKLIPDIPVLLWNEHLNPEEYLRLKQFKGCYGWLGIDYGDLKKCLRHFNTSEHRYMFPGLTPDHDGCIRCAVVGNGGILRGSGKGREIDGHEFVWRVNAAITEGFEEDVGKRTSFYFHDINTMKNSQAAARKHGFRGPPQGKDTVYASIGSGIRDYMYFDAAISWKPVESGRDKSKAPPGQYGEKPASTQFRMLHPDFMRYLKFHWLNSSRGYGRFEGIYRPTTGAAMLLTALHTCDITDAYGFITANHREYNDHYYEKDWHKVVFYANHDFQFEIGVWDKLDKAGIMNLYRGKKSETSRKRR